MILLKRLISIDGIGETRAKELIAQGVKSISDLKKDNLFNTLPLQTQFYLYNKPLKKIPRPLITEIMNKISKNFNKKIMVLGSYRREHKFSRDIDIQVFADLSKVKSDLENALNKIGSWIPYSSGDDKMSGYFRVGRGKVVVKLDFFGSKSPFMTLYATGSKEWNIYMRAVARNKGLLLNQNGLYKGEVAVQGLKSEADIFKYLDIPWREPKNR